MVEIYKTQLCSTKPVPYALGKVGKPGIVLKDEQLTRNWSITQNKEAQTKYYAAQYFRKVKEN